LIFSKDSMKIMCRDVYVF